MGPEELPPEEARGLLQRIQSSGLGRVYVLELEGRLVGTFTLWVLPNLGHGGRPFAVLESVVVAEELRGQGLGRFLTAWAAGEARRQGAYKLALSSSLSREAAHRFYQALGFEVYGISLKLEL
ncbi:MAG: GNAT family N-acetyltransferase [Meiothermus sp.]|nr:GNAT family N-acetyltransferase [Meiothermus sp.]